jgi:hypothetical protein
VFQKFGGKTMENAFYGAGIFFFIVGASMLVGMTAELVKIAKHLGDQKDKE